MEFRKKGAGAWKDSVKNAVAVPSLPIIGHPLRNDLQTAPRYFFGDFFSFENSLSQDTAYYT